MIVYAQSSGQHSTNSGSWSPIPGLTVTLPRGIGDSALLILNIPNPYAQGTNNPGGNFGLQVNGEVLSAFACFTYNEQVPPSTGRVPTTLSVVTPLSRFFSAPHHNLTGLGTRNCSRMGLRPGW